MHTTLRHPKLFCEDGQSIVEFAFVMPFLVFLLLAIWQFGVAFHDYLTITDAARVGARMAAVSRTASAGTCQSAMNAIQNTVSSSQWSVISSRITCNPSSPGSVGSSYTISITYPATIGLPSIFGLPGMDLSWNLSSSATERLE